MANIGISEREGLVERVRDDTGPYLQARLRELSDHPIVGEVRGVGLIAAVEMVADKAARSRFPGDGRAGQICRDHCFRNNIVLRAVRDAMVVSPPLIISREQIDLLVERLRHCLDLTARDLGAA